MDILFVCGGGMSSGFMAQNVAKAGREEGLTINIEAIGESEIEDYIEGKDLVLLGPHMKYLEEELSEVIRSFGVPYDFISDQDYATMNGKSILKQAKEILQK